MTHIEPIAPADWPALAGTFADSTYATTIAHASALAERDSAELESIAIVNDGKTIGAACVRIRRLPVVPSMGGLAYVAAGPLCRRQTADDSERLGQCLDALRAEYTERRGLTLRILGPIGSPGWNEMARSVFVEHGLATMPSTRGYRTFTLPIDTTEDELRANMSKYWRRNLRRSERESFTLERGTNPALFDALEPLLRSAERRKSFNSSLGIEFHRTVQERLPESERLEITLLRDGANSDVVLAAIACSVLGDTCLPIALAATQEGHRRYAVYRLQWQTILDARQRGQRYYDLGGIDPDANPSVFDFKKGLRGIDISAPGPYEATPGVLTHWLLRGAERTHRLLRRAA